MSIVAATLVGLTVAMLVIVVLPTPVRVERRLAPYVQTHRRRAGLSSDVAVAVDPGFVTSGGPVAAIRRAIAGAAGHVVGDVLDVGDNDELRLRLRRAGVEPPTASTYRAHQMRSATIGGAVALCGGLLLRQFNLSLLLILAGSGFLLGAIVFKVRLEFRAGRRTVEMQLALYTVTQVLAVLTRANRGPVGAVRHLVTLGRGPLVDELRLAIGWIERGTSAEQAFEQLSRDAPSASVARLFRLLSSSTSSGGNVADSLRSQAEQVRIEHSEQLEQMATKKRSAMVIPSIVFMVPVLIAYIVIPLISEFFG